jgi:predicted dehydrogenase
MNFLVIGLGSAGQRHLRVLHKSWGNKANMFAYRGNHKRGLISDGLDYENFSINPIEFYKAKEINTINELSTNTWDLVVIATPPDSHYTYIRKIISNSKRILVEKPLTIKATEASNIIELAKHNNIPIITGYQMVFHPFHNFIKNNLSCIGEIKSCATVFREDLSLMNPFRNMENHHLSKLEGGGAFLSLSHDLDFVLTVFDQSLAENIFFTDIVFSNNGLLVECTLDCTIWSKPKHVNLQSKFSILPGQTLKTGEILGSHADIYWDFIEGIIEVRQHSGKKGESLNYLSDKDYLFKYQIEKVLSLKTYSNYCQNNLSRAKFIVETNSRIKL